MTDSIANELRHELAALPASLRERLNAAGFDEARFIALASSVARGERAERNRVAGEVSAPLATEVVSAPLPGTAEAARLAAIGEEAIRKGELAFIVMAGGMATRMGGVVKALVEALPGRTFLDLRLAENATWSKRAGKPIPLWLMTSEATHAKTVDALRAASAPPHVETFMQDLGVRITAEGRLFRGDDGAPSTYATGHGDLVDAVRRSGLLRNFRARGGKYVWIANLDNLGASIDPVILGHFISTASPVMVEVTEKVAGDKGGIPVHANGKLQVLEEFRLPTAFDATTVRVFNTNTFLVHANALDTVTIPWNWFRVEKTVDGRPAVQFERLLQELTAALDAAYVKVPRDGESSRFLPVKDTAELTRRRSEIECVARARGMI
jgi:UTP--glucose-1-phosphate uridylyltransferase